MLAQIERNSSSILRMPGMKRRTSAFWKKYT
jgi:hypothetical protein